MTAQCLWDCGSCAITKQTIDAFTLSQAARPEVLGVVVVGSVARGDERPDSDVDVYLVVTDEAYADAARSGQVAFVSKVGVAYEGGYVDVKLASPELPSRCCRPR